MSDDEMKEEKEPDLRSPDVVTKYKCAAEVANTTAHDHQYPELREWRELTLWIDCSCGEMALGPLKCTQFSCAKSAPHLGLTIHDSLCLAQLLRTELPFQPIQSVLLTLLVCRDIGCHVDGFTAVVAHTHVLSEGPVTGCAADVLAAAHTAVEVALRLVRPGKKNKDVTEAIQKVASAYDCKIAEGVLSHQLKQLVIDTNKVILSVSNPETRVDDAEFEENEVYAIDIVTSTGDGKPKLLDEKQTTVYKRAVDKNYHLKMKASKFIRSEINSRFPLMPFTARALEEKRARLGLVECVNHELLQPYPVLHEKSARIKFTVLLMPNGSDKITGVPLQEYQQTKVPDDPEIKAWLGMGIKSNRKGGGKKKKGKK
nr:ERBB-3 BINDING PROTEIN 1-like [Physcomitrium patens]|eukprot:XP_024389812.1 ERBB-3 BINDING PROTEIN 1-like [Physcomitrella patens]